MPSLGSWRASEKSTASVRSGNVWHCGFGHGSKWLHLCSLPGCRAELQCLGLRLAVAGSSWARCKEVPIGRCRRERFRSAGDLRDYRRPGRKMTFQALYRLERRGLLQCPVLGVASDDITAEELVNRAHKAIADAGEKSTTRCSISWRTDCPTCTATSPPPRCMTRWPSASVRSAAVLPGNAAVVVRADRREPGQGRSAEGIARRGGKALRSRLEVRPGTQRPAACGVGRGPDLPGGPLPGKEPVVELEYLRFGNLALVELWDRQSISEIQITMAETSASTTGQVLRQRRRLA